ncbi:MAG: DUF1801 domain-containing protein [Dermabacter sp.]|nr:DUF1801 domain-containing protein [Dermabacter sp.]
MARTSPAMSPDSTPVTDVLDRATGPRRSEADSLLTLFRELSGEEPVVWAGRIIGFGTLEYRYESGHGGIMPLIAFAPGPARHTIYLTSGFAERWPEILARLGPHRASTACLYITRLARIDLDALRALVEASREVALAENTRVPAPSLTPPHRPKEPHA